MYNVSGHSKDFQPNAQNHQTSDLVSTGSARTPFLTLILVSGVGMTGQGQNVQGEPRKSWYIRKCGGHLFVDYLTLMATYLHLFSLYILGQLLMLQMTGNKAK